jgi:hypothetical protein
VSRARPIPFGPEWKDPPWRWGAWMLGVVGFVALLAITTALKVNVLGWWSFVFVVLGYLLSIRSGRSWSRGRQPDRHFSPRHTTPSVDVQGQAGSTYVLVSPPRSAHGGFVRPRELSPGWWALYSVVVRAPVALGDAVLTTVWRFTRNFWGYASAVERVSPEEEGF